MKFFKLRKWRVLAVVVSLIAVTIIAAICAVNISKSDCTPLLSTEILDVDYSETSDCSCYSYGGALYYTRRVSTFSDTKGQVVIKRKSNDGTKTIAKVDGKYEDEYIVVFDETHVVLQRDPVLDDALVTLVMYNTQDKTEYILTETEKLAYGERAVACRSDGVYFRRQVESNDGSAAEEETDPVYAVFRYSPLTGIEEEIHRYSGEDLSVTSEGIWYVKGSQIVFFSFDDQNMTVLDEINWPERLQPYFDKSRFLCSADYIVRLSGAGIDVHDVKSGETKEILSGEYLQMCAFITPKELCFSQWEVDIGNWRSYEKADGTYKYTFESGVLEKIVSDDCWSFAVLDERTLLAKTTFGFWKKIKF